MFYNNVKNFKLLALHYAAVDFICWTLILNKVLNFTLVKKALPDTRELSSVVCINKTILNQGLNTMKPTPELFETRFFCKLTILPNFLLKQQKEVDKMLA